MKKIILFATILSCQLYAQETFFHPKFNLSFPTILSAADYFYLDPGVFACIQPELELSFAHLPLSKKKKWGIQFAGAISYENGSSNPDYFELARNRLSLPALLTTSFSQVSLKLRLFPFALSPSEKIKSEKFRPGFFIDLGKSFTSFTTTQDPEAVLLGATYYAPSTDNRSPFYLGIGMQPSFGFIMNKKVELTGLLDYGMYRWTNNRKTISGFTSIRVGFGANYRF